MTNLWENSAVLRISVAANCLEWQTSVPKITLYTWAENFCSAEVSSLGTQSLGIIADKCAALQVAFSLNSLSGGN